MEARRELLKRLASVSDWGSGRRTAFAGESWVETRNTIYRFRDGVCFQVASRGGRGAGRDKGRGRSLIGMRLVAWLTGTEECSRLAYEWETGAYAVLWRPEGPESDEVMALTSRTVAFELGQSPVYLQAIHDHAPPHDSQLLRRVATPAAAPRPPLPSYASRPT
jgi:hypothetical protein